MKKVLLISTNTEKNPTAIFPLGLGYIQASLLAAGYETGIMDLVHLAWEKSVIQEYLRQYNPDIIGVAVRNLDNCCMQRPRSFLGSVTQVISWIRQWNPATPIIMGGAGFSLLPEEWLTTVGADYGIIGDGIDSMVRLIRQLDKQEALGAIAGLIYAENGGWIVNQPLLADNLDQLHFPKRDGYIHPLAQEVVVRHNIQTKRGCPFQCSYCSYGSLEGCDIRIRSPRNVIQEIKELAVHYKIDRFDFVDSLFNYPVEHAETICTEIIEARLVISWGCFLNPRYVSHNLLSRMKQAGCQDVEFGIDSGNTSCLKAMKKNFGLEDIKHAADLCKEVGISFSFVLLFGGPGETLDTAKETLQLMEDLKIEKVFGLIGIRILPMTEIYKRYMASHRVTSLLPPKFYLSEQINLQALCKELEGFQKKHPGWVFV